MNPSSPNKRPREGLDALADAAELVKSRRVEASVSARSGVSALADTMAELAVVSDPVLNSADPAVVYVSHVRVVAFRGERLTPALEPVFVLRGGRIHRCGKVLTRSADQITCYVPPFHEPGQVAVKLFDVRANRFFPSALRLAVEAQGAACKPDAAPAAAPDPEPAKKRENNPALTAWFMAHTDNPFPTHAEKEELLRLSGLGSMKRLVTWFGNARSRYKQRAEEEQQKLVREGAAPRATGAAQPAIYCIRPDDPLAPLVAERVEQRIAARRVTRENLPKPAVRVLEKWLEDHAANPFPGEEEKLRLGAETGLFPNQIANWFINARRRKFPAADRPRAPAVRDDAPQVAAGQPVTAFVPRAQGVAPAPNPADQAPPAPVPSTRAAATAALARSLLPPEQRAAVEAAESARPPSVPLGPPPPGSAFAATPTEAPMRLRVAQQHPSMVLLMRQQQQMLAQRAQTIAKHGELQQQQQQQQPGAEPVALAAMHATSTAPPFGLGLPEAARATSAANVRSYLAGLAGAAAPQLPPSAPGTAAIVSAHAEATRLQLGAMQIQMRALVRKLEQLERLQRTLESPAPIPETTAN